MIRIELVGPNEHDGRHIGIPAWTPTWREARNPHTNRNHPTTHVWTYHLDNQPTNGVYRARLQPDHNVL